MTRKQDKPGDIPNAEWTEAVAALEKAAGAPGGDGWMSSCEMRERLGLSTNRAKCLLRDLHRAGRIECARRASTNAALQLYYVPVYRIRKAAKGARS